MTFLGIETSTAVCSVGLADESGVRAERSLVESHIHSEKLLTLISEIFEACKMKISQLDGVAVSIGPGSFTGLRIGLSTAKGICYASDRPIIAVPTFEAVATGAFTSHPGSTRVIVCVDAKQGDYYFSVYERKDSTFNEAIPIRIVDLSAVIAAISEGSVLVTDCVDEMKKNSRDSWKIEDILRYCRGDMIASIAVEKCKTGIESNLERLEPMYLKDFIVRTSAK